jgi:hypothetical protein
VEIGDVHHAAEYVCSGGRSSRTSSPS